jgi:hypothetical protein
MTDIFEGDPKLVLGPDGSKFVYRDGQPVMDQGIENSVSIDLGTKKRGEHSHRNGWVGNYLFRNPDERIGTDYQEYFENMPITLQTLAQGEQQAKAALTNRIYGEVSSTVSNPETDKVLDEIIIQAPSGAFKFYTETVSQLWKFQAIYPANERI